MALFGPIFHQNLDSETETTVNTNTGTLNTKKDFKIIQIWPKYILS